MSRRPYINTGSRSATFYVGLLGCWVLAGCGDTNSGGVLTGEKAQLPPMVVGESKFLNHTFKVVNPRTIPLAISRIEKTCSCSDVELSQMTIPPKGEVDLRFQVDLKGRSGAFGAAAAVVDEAGLRASYGVSVMIYPKLLFEPKRLRFDSLKPNEQVRQELKVTTYTRGKQAIAPELKSKPVGNHVRKNGGRTEIRLVNRQVRRLPGDIYADEAIYDVLFIAPQQVVRDSFRLFVPRKSDDGLTVHWSVKGPYEVEPKRIVVSKLDGDFAERMLEIRRVDGESLLLSGVRSSSESVSCELEVVGAVATVTIRVDAKHVGRFMATELIVETADPTFPEVVVPLVVSR